MSQKPFGILNRVNDANWLFIGNYSTPKEKKMVLLLSIQCSAHFFKYISSLRHKNNKRKKK